MSTSPESDPTTGRDGTGDSSEPAPEEALASAPPDAAEPVARDDGESAGVEPAALDDPESVDEAEPVARDDGESDWSPLQLFLLRHADAGDPLAWDGDDVNRPLSPKGRRQAKRLGEMLSDLDWRPDAFLTSPKKRALQTARIVGRAIEVDAEADERLGGPIGTSDLASLLAGLDGPRRVLLVGHDPDFSALASTLTGAAIELKKGALARIDLADSMADGGALRWLIPPGAIPD